MISLVTKTEMTYIASNIDKRNCIKALIIILVFLTDNTDITVDVSMPE